MCGMRNQISPSNTNYIQLRGAWCVLGQFYILSDITREVTRFIILFHFSRCSRIWARGEFFPLQICLVNFMSSLIIFGKYFCFLSLPSTTLFLSYSLNWMLPQIFLSNTNYIQLLGSWCLLGQFYSKNIVTIISINYDEKKQNVITENSASNLKKY